MPIRSLLDCGDYRRIFINARFPDEGTLIHNTPHPPTTMSTSTPCRPSSGQVAPNISEGATSSGVPRLQSDLKRDMEEEIANQTFSYPSDKLARMLSPKKLRPGPETPGNLPCLDQYKCDVDSQPFCDALNIVVTQLKPITPGSNMGESTHYSCLIEFLT